jgi:hypothetical protein
LSLLFAITPLAVCPIWPGQPITARGAFDPAAVAGSPAQIERAFSTFVVLDRRIRLFLSLPLSSLDKLALKKKSIASDINEVRSARYFLDFKHGIAAICVSGVRRPHHYHRSLTRTPNRYSPPLFC